MTVTFKKVKIKAGKNLVVYEETDSDQCVHSNHDYVFLYNEEEVQDFIDALMIAKSYFKKEVE